MTTEPRGIRWQKYISENSRRSVPVIKEKGFSVWSVVGYYRACEEDKKRVLADYGGGLTEEELDAALFYYQEYPDEIDRKLWELEH